MLSVQTFMLLLIAGQVGSMDIDGGSGSRSRTIYTACTNLKVCEGGLHAAQSRDDLLGRRVRTQLRG